MEKEVYLLKYDGENFAYIMVKVESTNYLSNWNSLVLLTKECSYFIPCSISQNKQIMESFFNNNRCWINLSCFYYKTYQLKENEQYNPDEEEKIYKRNLKMLNIVKKYNENEKLTIIGSN